MSGTAQENKEKSAVRLFAGPTTAEATAQTEGHRFSRVAASYILVYTDEPDSLPEGFIEIEENDAHLLTDADRRWLTDCQNALMIEHIRDNTPKMIERLNQLLSLVEQLQSNERGNDDGKGSAE